MTAPTVTEHEAVQRERAAFVMAYHALGYNPQSSFPDEEAARRFPLPDAPQTIQFAVCAFSPCRRTYETAKGRSGVFCSDRCLRAELADDGSTFAPGLSLADARQDDERVSA